MKCVLVALVATLSVCRADVPADMIQMLPGLSTMPSFKQYSGYLQATGTKHLHYWFVESMNDPMNDPVVLWLNGGPGCSSVLGLLTENGPFKVMMDGKTVMMSKNSWNQIANVLYIESPAGVGFSYSDDKNYTTDDNEVAQDNYKALKDFFSKFPEFSKQPFFTTGESYGGIYIPTLSALIVNDPNINFMGMGIGNGLSDDRLNDNSLIYFAYYHGLIGDKAWMDLHQSCCPNMNMNQRCFFTDMMSDATCANTVNKALAVVFNEGLNIYNLYGECAGGVQSDPLRTTAKLDFPLSMLRQVQRERARVHQALQDKKPLRMDPPCIDAKNTAMWLNTKEVRKALHIPDVVPNWSSCSAEVNTKYVRIYHNVAQFYRKVLMANKRVLVYNGDIDMACNFLGDEWFVGTLNLPVLGERREWFYKAADGTKQVAGFVKEYKNLNLVTVRGAGHMVPTDKPMVGFKMFMNFIMNKPM